MKEEGRAWLAREVRNSGEPEFALSKKKAYGVRPNDQRSGG